MRQSGKPMRSPWSAVCSVQLCIFFLGHRLTPFVPTVFTGNLYGDMNEPGVLFSLCQCLTLPEIIITLPSCKLTAALPSSRYQPLPAVQSQSCPPPFEAQLVCRLFKGHLGGKKNTASRDGEAVQTGFPWTSRCRFSSLRTRLAVWYPPSVRRCWFWIRSCHRHTLALLAKQL